VVRRASARPDDGDPPRLIVDRRTRDVFIDGRPITLTPKEFDLLALLAEDPGAVCSREQILDEVWDPHWYGPTKTLDVHVSSLRRKLGDDSQNPRFIHTVRGVGFRFAAADEL
jgi:DNA-binding response OmpR family regulator